MLPVVLLGASLLTACTNTPPPPLVGKSAPSSAPVSAGANSALISMSDVQGGFNPHLLADRSTITTALSTLLLPSVFRPAADGAPQLDTSVMRSAEVTGTQPFTVTYTLRTDASWSDGVPVAAEDFVYLREQMDSQPGVVHPAGYRLISDVTSAQNGKVVKVTFAKPYPGWRSLFSDLLPAHLLKDAPGGWNAGMRENFPAVAGPFMVKQADLDRGMITLQRSERYWATPSVLDGLVFRESDNANAVRSLRSGDSQLASLPADEPVRRALDSLGGGAGSDVRVSTVYRPDVAELLLRQQTPQLSDIRVRRAVAFALDRESLISDMVGGDVAQRLRTDAMVTAPSQQDYTPTMPADAPGAKRDLRSTAELLRAAGYQRGVDGWAKDGTPLRLVIAAPNGEGPYVALARLVSKQLGEAGIGTTVITPDPDVLFGERLSSTAPSASGTASRSAGGAANAPVDILLAPRPVGGDLAATLAAFYGCPQTPPNTTTAAPGNPAGFCDEDLQPTIDAALTGEMSVHAALAEVEPVLWRRAVAMPLFQLADQVAVNSSVTGVDLAPELYGPFPSASLWHRRPS
ncbi:MAG: ABC transporter family substrate-binding protein [Sciscionella sp.]